MRYCRNRLKGTIYRNNAIEIFLCIGFHVIRIKFVLIIFENRVIVWVGRRVEKGDYCSDGDGR